MITRIGIVGATGYTGEELVDILLRNKNVEITSLSGLVDKEAPFSEMYPRFRKRTSLVCKNLNIDEVSSETDLVFLALPHTVSMKIAPEFLKKGKKVIDLSADYRLPSDVYQKWYGAAHVDTGHLAEAVYGLPELNRDKIKNADLIANPGCYPTGTILALAPIIKMVTEKKLDIIVDAKSGVTGAGRKALMPLLFGEVDEDFKCYKPNEHQHIPEMEHVLSGVASSSVKINFVPHLLPIKRGILSTIYIQHKNLPEEKEIYRIYENFYKASSFVRVHPLGQFPQIKDVAHTNFCNIGLKVARGVLVIVSVIDNLLKGAAGQAVQNMNIMLDLDERTALI